MKVLFIYPDVVTPVINFCPAVHILSAVAKQAGHQTSMIHVNNDWGTLYREAAILDRVRQERPDLIAVTSTSFNYRHASEIAAWLKNAFPHTPRILGGSHATVQPEDLATSCFDAFCVGEGEEPLLDILACMEKGRIWNKIPNLIVRNPDGSISNNPVRGFLKDLESLPQLDFDITDTLRILKARQGWMSVSFSRGCPYECTFCINHLYKERLIGPEDKLSHYHRRKSPVSTVTELEHLAHHFKGDIKIFNFDDDLLPMNREWMKEFAKRYERQILRPFGIKYAINCRATFLDDELAVLFRSSGCLEVRIGFETGNESLRATILGKPICDDDLVRAFSVCDRHGVRTNAFAMMGIPGESEKSFADTVRMILTLKPYLIRMTFLYPYAHTRIHHLCVKEKLLKPALIHKDSFAESPLRFEHLTDEQVFCFRFLFPWYVNSRWFGDSTKGEYYKALIKRFAHRPIGELRQLVPEIIKTDAEASAVCDRPHFRYFKSNAYYFQLAGKYNEQGDVLVPCVTDAH